MVVEGWIWVCVNIGTLHINVFFLFLTHLNANLFFVFPPKIGIKNGEKGKYTGKAGI